MSYLDDRYLLTKADVEYVRRREEIEMQWKDYKKKDLKKPRSNK